MDIPKEQEREGTSQKEEPQAIDSAEKNGDRASASTESSLLEKRDMTLAPFTQKREREAPAGKGTGPKMQRARRTARATL
jgi:hypothetical protein